eukprot:Rmarinus@m.15841
MDSVANLQSTLVSLVDKLDQLPGGKVGALALTGLLGLGSVVKLANSHDKGDSVFPKSEEFVSRLPAFMQVFIPLIPMGSIGAFTIGVPAYYLNQNKDKIENAVKDLHKRACDQMGSETKGTLMCVAAVLGPIIAHHLYNVRKHEICRSSHPEASRKKVLVVGAGISGITAVKELLAHGHHVTCYEKAEAYGGVWKFGVGVGVYRSTLSTSSAMVTSYSDLIPKQYWPENKELGTPYHMRHGQYVDYLKQYMDHFNLDQYITLNAEVLKMDYINGQWHVESRVNGEIVNGVYDAVACAAGLHQAEYIPRYPGQEEFEGKIEHSGTYVDAEPYKGKTVVLVGGGESGADLVKEVADENPGRTYLSLRRGVFVLPRDMYGVPPDYHNFRALNFMPHFLKGQFINIGTLKFFHQNSDRPYMSWIRKLAEMSGGTLHAQFATKSERFCKSLADESCKLVGEIARYTKTGVVLKDGSEIKNVDVVLFCTGYKTVFPFLPTPLREHDARDRYKFVFHPELPNVAFIGCCRPGLGAIPPISEMQARWFTLFLDGKLSLPEKECMMKTICMEREEHMVRKHLIQERLPHLVTFETYMNDLANIVGCQPNPWKVFLVNPKLWYKMMFAPFTAHQFRHEGPDAKPDITYEVLRQLPVPNAGFGYSLYIGHMVLLMIAPLAKLYSKLPVVGTHFTPVFSD